MRWRPALTCALATVIPACAAVDSFVHGSAHLRLDRAAPPSHLLDVPVDAAYCAADTTLTIVGADGSWSVALALKTPWPARSTEFTLDSAVGGPGTGAVAIRAVGDSIGVAMTAARGSVRLGGGDKLSGALDFVTTEGRDTVRLVGTLSPASVAVGGCPAP